MTKLSHAPIRGMQDIPPHDVRLYQHLESTIQKVLSTYGYEEIRFPVVENTALFLRSVGEHTDIVNKEMYTFPDRNEQLVTLRPEGTVSCLRAAIAQNLLNQPATKLFYHGPMFRYERPQKGRLRQFHHLGVEAYGYPSGIIDIEMLQLTHQCWQELGIDGLTLQLNYLISGAERQQFITDLQAYFQDHLDQLSTVDQQRLEQNPLRILDSKSEAVCALKAQAPQMHDYLSSEARDEFAWMQAQLQALDIPFEHNPYLVRGLDYYTGLVYEWTCEKHLGSQATVCAGGRYDQLAELLSTQSTPSCGFAIGMERLLIIHQACQTPPDATVKIMVITMDKDYTTYSMDIAQRLRQASSAQVLHHGQVEKISKGLSKAHKLGASWAIIIGEQEHEQQQVTIKNMSTGEQTSIDTPQLNQWAQSIGAAL